MKPHDKTVTLIDLEGKPIVNLSLLSAELFDIQTTYAYVYYEKDWDLNDLFKYELKLNQKIVDMTYYQSDCKDTILKLCKFVNDQLTFIRNKMWETLAIYQTTLGRYTEVPWYDPKVLEPKHEQNYNVRALDEYDLSKGYFDQEYTDLEGCQYCANAKEFTWAMFVHEHLVIGLDENVPQEITAMAIQPMLDDFIKYYPDVFSKLTPLEGK